MSTFKVQPIYAELPLGWLDAAQHWDSPYTTKDVLECVAWTFKGGTLGDYPMRFATEWEATRFPDASTLELAKADDYNAEVIAMRQLLARRREEGRKRARSRFDWYASYAAARSMQADVDPHTQVKTGLTAVYSVTDRLWSSAQQSGNVPTWERLKIYTRESVVASASASHLHVPTCTDLVASTFHAIAATRLAMLTKYLNQYIALMRATGHNTQRARARQIGRRVEAGDITVPTKDLYEVLGPRHEIGGLVFYACHNMALVQVRGSVIALSNSDIQRVHQMLTAICSGLYATVAQACTAPGPDRKRAHAIAEAYEAQVTRIMAAAHATPAGDEVSICKSFKRAFSAFLGEIAGPLCADETKELWAETFSTKHGNKYDLAGWVEEIRGYSAPTSFNLGKVYKICPAPDASPGLTLIERHEMVTNRNVASDTMLPRFASMHRDQMLRAYLRKPGVKLALRPGIAQPAWWPEYRAGVLDNVPTSEIHDYLAWEGTAIMPERSAHDPSVWKDSGLGWDSYEEAIDPDRPAKHGNMLVRMVFDSGAAMPGVRHHQAQHDHKIDIKPEGHKDPARGIYSGNLKDRLNQSWMEVAVENVARFHPAFMIGADSATRDERVKAIVARIHDPRKVDVYYSFDVAGWSPRMDPRIQEASHANWAMLYDEELFRRAAAINDGARIYMNKAGYRGWFTNPGANLEGYNGKEMTYVLITLLCLAVEDWRNEVVERGLASRDEADTWAAVLLAYIDDGLAKLTLPRDRAKDLFKTFQACTVDCFSKCGFTVELSKCYPSDRFAIFLNEPYLGGRHIVHGTRAAMTICAENTEPHTTIIERVSSVSTGCRGAVMSGLDALAGTMLQAYHTFKHVEEWVRHPDPVMAALWSFAPRAWGGLGLPTALQLGTSGGGSALEESVFTMQCWARSSIPAKKLFLRCVRMDMRKRNAVGVLMAPLGGRVSTAAMVESRVPDAVREALTRIRTDGGLSRLAREFLAYSSTDSLETFAENLIPMQPGTTLQEQLLSDLASAHPHAIFSTFARRLEKSTTLMTLIGPRAVRQIIKQNRIDARKSFEIFSRQVC
jgi:hypothetical protein